jgi:zinc metalloprotease ZmpB
MKIGETMARLTPTKDNRTTYDEKTGAVRSFFGSELVAPVTKAVRGLKTEGKADDFLKVNRDHFKLEDITLEKAETSEGTSVKSVRYIQKHMGIPIYGADVVVGMRKADSGVISTINNADYDIPKSLDRKALRLSAEDAIDRVHKQFDDRFKGIYLGTPILYIYRHVPRQLDPGKGGSRENNEGMIKLGTGKAGKVYLAWQVFMDTKGPGGNWELMIDAVDGKLISVMDRRRYATVKGKAFWPDPIRSSQNDNLTWESADNVLNGESVDVDLENLEAAVNGKYKLWGDYVRVQNKEDPAYTPSETTTDFRYDAKTAGATNRDFLGVMAYYYLDRVINCLRGFGNTKYNTETTNKPMPADAQGLSGDDNSHFVPPALGGPYVAFGEDTMAGTEGGVPDAADPGVILHEYGHAIHYLMYGEKQNGPYEEGFNDWFAAMWLDRYNLHQFQREEAMPWDQHTHGTSHWGPTRRVDLTDRFDDSSFNSFDMYHKGDVYATALWDVFLNIGGNSGSEDVRKWAADELIRTYLEMLVAVKNNNPVNNLVLGLKTADEARTGGLYKKVIWDAFRRRGLWSDFTPIGNVDPYIRDSDTDTGEHASPQVHWTSPDIWVRNNPPTDPGENPDDGHQPPINNVPNYLYVQVHNRGSQQAAANTFSVEAFHCNPATAMLWPTHFNSIGTLPITTAIPQNSGSVRVGPFLWTPQIVDHECLLAIVSGSSDPSIADDVKAKGPVDHWKLVRFDNNVGQRNVAPYSSTGGGKTKTTFLVRGSDHPTKNTLHIDATPMPSDTKISVRVTRNMVDQAKSMSGFKLKSQNRRWSTLSLEGGKEGIIADFPLVTNEERGVTLEIDFSYQAENLKRYPIVATQEQDGTLAGKLTIEITAVKESEDYVYGNMHSRELHTFDCAYRKKMSPHNQVPFENIKDALARGYEGCAFCLPEYNTD